MVGISSRKQIGRPRNRGKYNVKMHFRKMVCEDGRWMELAQDHVQWQALVLAVLNLRVLLPELVN
jgi:hypothetical protein